MAAELKQKLHDLEERAEELDKMRTSTISSISYINDRNRKKNVEEAEKAIMEEVRANKGKKIDDPFTRRSTKPRMVFKAQDQMDGMTAASLVRTFKLDIFYLEIAVNILKICRCFFFLCSIFLSHGLWLRTLLFIWLIFKL